MKPASAKHACSASAQHGSRGSMLGHGNVVLVPDARCSASIHGPNCVIAKDFKSCTYCCYVRCATLIVRVVGMPWPQRDTTY